MNVYFNPANALGTAMYFDQASLNVVQNSPFGVITAFGGGVQARVPDIVPSYLYNTPQISPIFNFGGNYGGGFDFGAMFSQMMQWFSGMFSSGGKDYSNLTPADRKSVV
jgi:hypothetical protein